jgi:hypothetical protein
MKTHEKSKRGGRPTKLTPSVQAEICEAIEAGNYIEPSAIRAGVAKETLYNWLRRAGREIEKSSSDKRYRIPAKERKYIEFLHAVKEAEAQAEATDLETIRRAASLGQWQAAAWRLERKHYDRWGRKQAIEHSGPDGKAVKVQRIRIGDDTIEF